MGPPARHARAIVVVLAAIALLVVSREASAVPGNDTCVGAKVIDALPFRHTTNTSTATADPSDPAFSCFAGFVNPGARSVWYAVTSSRAMTLEADTFDTYEPGEVFGTAIVAHRGTCGALTQVACNEHDFDDLDDTSMSRVLIPVAAGETVFLQVFDDGGAGGAVTLTVRASPVFQVSTYDPFEILNYPGVGMTPGGEFMVAWREQRPGLGQGVIAGRTYDSSAAPVAPPFVVNTSNPHGSYRPEVDADGLGNFVVAWGAAFGSAFVRKFDATGTPVGPEVTIPVTDGYFFADVGAAANGNFVVVWQEDASVGDVVAQRFDATSTPVGSPIVVQDDGAYSPRVAMADDGHFVVAWTDTPNVPGGVTPGTGDGSFSGVFARLYDASGTPAGPRFLVNEVTTGRQGDGGPAVSMDGTGNFVVTWNDDPTNLVKARRFDVAGSALGGEFQVNEEETFGYYSKFPAVAHDSAGRFMVVWNRDGDGPRARRFDTAGAPLGPELRVSHVDDFYQYEHDLAGGDDGFVIVWPDIPIGDATFIHGRRVPPAATPICTRNPRAGCLGQTVPGAGLLSVKDVAPNQGDRFLWKWVKGDATTPADIGDPLTNDSYTVCVYGDHISPLRWQMSVSGGGECGGKPCWKDLGGTGARYVEKKALVEGAQKLVAKAGPVGGAKMVVKGKGSRLTTRSRELLPLNPPVTVQLVSTTGICWQSVYDLRVSVNTPTQFVAAAD